ncbi:MAG TPA: tripartite tricarboxylate transporter substrate binding protein [Burkholderiales bacterium]|nr:tripartite tricarboxylate transporter substrate binding protein [Burkholderiales bacterium]
MKTIFFAVSIVLAAAVSPAAAQGFKPSKPIEFVTHTGPGGGGDVIARAISAGMEKEKIAPVRMNVVNKTGGSGATAMAYLVEKRGDTHTIAIYTGLWISNPLMRKEAKVTVKDLTPIAGLVREPAMLVVKSDSPFKTLKDFIDAAKANPGQLKQSAGSIGARDWVVRQLLMTNTGANWAYISFPGGGERIAALLGGHVNMMLIEPQEAGEHIRAGNLRVIAQVSEQRLAAYPDIPTIKEAGFDVPNVPQVRGIVAPPDLPADVVAFYEDLFARFTKTATWRKYLDDNLFEEGFVRSADLGQFFERQMEVTRGILKEGGVKVVR